MAVSGSGIVVVRYRQCVLQQHALVCTVEGQQLHEAQVAQLIAQTMVEECLAGVVQEFDGWCAAARAAKLIIVTSVGRCSDAVETIALREAEP